jgi:glutaredoxin
VSEEQTTEPRVKLLVLSTCLQCKALMELLREHEVTFEATNIDLLEQQEREELLRRMEPYNEKKAFPVAFIGNKAIVGFQKKVILAELGVADGC